MGVGTDTPSRRDGPPFHMTDMIAAEPCDRRADPGRRRGAGQRAAAARRAVRAALDAGEPVVVHRLRDLGARRRSASPRSCARRLGSSPRRRAAQAFELSLDPPSSGLVIGISHEGGDDRDERGARGGPGGRRADRAHHRDLGARPARRWPTSSSRPTSSTQSWCHTVGYLSPIVAAAAVAGALTGAPVDPAVGPRARRRPARPPSRRRGRSRSPTALGGRRRASSSSRPGRTASPAASSTLKIEEGTWLPAAYRDLETFLHGHLAATDPTTAVVAIATDRRAPRTRDPAPGRGAARGARHRHADRGDRRRPTSTRRCPAELTSAGRIVVPEAPAACRPPVAALLVDRDRRSRR